MILSGSLTWGERCYVSFECFFHFCFFATYICHLFSEGSKWHAVHMTNFISCGLDWNEKEWLASELRGQGETWIWLSLVQAQSLSPRMHWVYTHVQLSYRIAVSVLLFGARPFDWAPSAYCNFQIALQKIGSMGRISSLYSLDHQWSIWIAHKEQNLMVWASSEWNVVYKK